MLVLIRRNQQIIFLQTKLQSKGKNWTPKLFLSSSHFTLFRQNKYPKVTLKNWKTKNLLVY